MKSSETKQSSKKSRPLNLRDFPEDLYWRCKVQAAEERISLKDFVIETLKKRLENSSNSH